MSNLYRTFLHLILICQVPASCSKEELNNLDQNGILVFLAEFYQHFQALRFALEEINGNPTLLPNKTLGFYVYDSCAALRREIEGTLWILTGKSQAIPNYSCREKPPLTAIIGHSKSTYSILMAHILGLYKYPQVGRFTISRGSLNNIIGTLDRAFFPSFFRTVPSDAFQFRGLAKLVLHFKWTWVGLIATNDDYGNEAIKTINEEIIKGEACVAYTLYITSNLVSRTTTNIVNIIKESSANVVIAISVGAYLAPILEEMLKQNVTGKNFVASEAWSISNFLLLSKYSPLLSGTIGFAFQRKQWVQILKSIHNGYNDVSKLRSSYNIYTAVHVIATALHDLSQCHLSNGTLFSDECSDIGYFKPHQLLHYFKNVRVKLSNNREIFFDKDGNPPAVYDIVNWQPGPDGSIKHVKVGSYDTLNSSGDVFSLNINSVWWGTGNQETPRSVCSQSCPVGFKKLVKRGEPVCCFQCVPCAQGEVSNQTDSIECWKCPWDMWPNSARNKCFLKLTEFLSYEDPLGLILAAVSAFSSMVPMSIFRLFFQYKSTPIVRANNYSVSCILLVSLSFCFLCALAFIGYPQPEKCLLRQAAFGLVFTLCVSCILAKTVIVVFAFMATKPGSSLKKWTTPRVPYMIITICTFIQLTLCVFWLTIFPPFLQFNIEAKPGIIIVECNENSQFAFWCMLGYLGILASVSFTVAFLARRLPDNFNEAKLITFSMLAFLSVWVYFIPASLSAQGKYTVAMEIFAILTSSWALVFCMFLPKCFIILFRPDMNSREKLMGK
uniref:G-protein coupled receptors family 3 profile domain-containing protein n=1 Tax=Xenopus tropicalis TaxID=8364 RepID=F7B4Y8_XENTR